MHKNFPVSGVDICKVNNSRRVKEAEYSAENFQVNQNEFSIQVEGVGSFYVCNGDEVEYAPIIGADPDWVNIYLNGQVLAALLHQRKIINFHASSFIYKNHGVMILGGTGAGKSSLTAAFTMDNAVFLSDDFTPVIFNEGIPDIWPVYKTIKVRSNTISQLQIDESRTRIAEQGTGKFFFEVPGAGLDKYPLHYIIKIEIGRTPSTRFTIPSPAENFELLRSEICSWEILNGMPETEKAYLVQLVEIVKHVEIIKVVRPEEILISELYRAICDYMSENYKLL